MTGTRHPEERRLAGLARFEPEVVEPSDVASLVDVSMSKVEAEAVQSLATNRPEAMESATPAITSCLDEGPENWGVELPLCDALGCLARTSSDAVPALINLAKSPSSDSRGNAIQGLGVAAGRDPAHVAPAVDLLFARLTDSSYPRRMAIGVLAALAAEDGQVRDRTRDLLDASAPKERGGAARVVARAVQEGCDEFREDATAVVDLLDGAQEVRRDVLRALDDLATVAPGAVEPALDDLLALLAGRGHSSRRLERAAKPAVTTLAADPGAFERLLDRAATEGANRPLADALSDVAGRHPTVVGAEGRVLVDLLEHDDRYVQGRAARVLAAAGETDPAAVGFAVDPLLDRLEESWEHPNAGALGGTCRALAVLAPHYPRIPRRVVGLLRMGRWNRWWIPDPVERGLRDVVADYRETGATAARHSTRHDPTVLYDEGAVPALRRCLEDGGRTAGEAAWALGNIGRVRPDALAPAVDDLVRAFTVDRFDRHDGVTRGLAEAARVDPAGVDRIREPLFEAYEDHRDNRLWDVIGALAAEDQAVFDRVLGLLDEEYRKPKQVIRTLAIAASEDPGTAEPHVETFVDLALAGPERSNATQVLAGIAHGAADALAPHVDVVRTLLYDPDWLVRQPAALAAAGLLAADVEAAGQLVDRLGRLLERDDGAVVRGCAAVALAQADRSTHDADVLVDAITSLDELDDADREWRLVRGVDALAALGTEEATAALRAVADGHDDHRVRQFAAARLDR